MNVDKLADAITETLSSPNVADANGEAANVVDTLHQIARALHHVARAIEFAAIYGRGDVADWAVDAIRKRVEEANR